VLRNPLRETGLEALRIVIGSYEVGEVLAQIIVAFVIEAPDRCLLDRPVHQFDLTVGPRRLRLGGLVIVSSLAPRRVHHWPGFPDRRGGRCATARRPELDAAVDEHGMDLVGTASISRRRKSREVAVFAFSCSSTNAEFCHFDVQVADRACTELAALGLVAFDLRQARDIVALQATCSDDLVRCGIVAGKT